MMLYTLAACRRHGIRFSITVRQIKTVTAAIAAISEAAWTDIDYPEGGVAQVACLVAELLHEGGVLVVGCPEHPDRRRALEHPVGGPVHAGHAPTPSREPSS